MWPYELVEYHSRRFVARLWFRAGDGMFDAVEQRAAFHANLRGKEIDIIGMSVMPSGKIAGRERIGVRVSPQ